MEKYYFITHDITEPYFNLASEEYLLKQKDGFYLYLWINAPSVIVGVNQNAFDEVNLPFTNANDIKVVRRLTGGGAVYHDLNNLCYTVIAPYDKDKDSFKYFSEPVIEYLKTLGLDAQFSGRNDILIDGKKISGTAQTVYKDRVMHHGTLLFNTDTSILQSALKPNKLKIESKGIKSVRSRVTNIKDCLKKDMTVQEFKDGLAKFFSQNATPYNFSNDDIIKIEKLKEEKYSTYEWNIGRSPKGKIKFMEKFNFGIMEITFDVIDGKMQNAEIHGDFFTKLDLLSLSQKLNGTNFEKQSVLSALSSVNDYIVGANANDIVDKLFC